MFNGNVVILDNCEAVELLEATTEGKALIKRDSGKCFKLESVELNRITIIPNRNESRLREFTEKIRRARSDENRKEHENSGE